MTIYNILNGGCLAEQLKQTEIKGANIICRECLIEGTLNGGTLSQFWTTRANYISENYGGTVKDYFNKVVVEFEKIINLCDNPEINLWFENDLFCQTNMWFILSLLFDRQAKCKIFRVFPTINDPINIWNGFGLSSAEMLEKSFLNKIEFTHKDMVLGNNLWKAYKENDLNKLKELSNSESDCFQLLKEVCIAQIDRFPVDKKLGRPDKLVKEIIDSTSRDFNTVFKEFSKNEGIYGFGDLQVRNIYNRQLQSQ